MSLGAYLFWVHLLPSPALLIVVLYFSLLLLGIHNFGGLFLYCSLLLAILVSQSHQNGFSPASFSPRLTI